MSRVATKTRVQMTIEVNGSCYGEDWSLRELANQTGKEAVNNVLNKLRESGIAVLGEPKVIAISSFVEE